MKLLYTDISQDMTAILAREAQALAQDGKRVFYIAPNSLSFDKERRVLEYLPNRASFDITITRFGQMARYLILNEVAPKESLDDTGLSMLFYKVLSGFDHDDLRIYGRLRQDASFIKQLVDLYKELKTANMTVLDLTDLDQPEKEQDLLKIFTALEDQIRLSGFEHQSKQAFFAKQIASGSLDNQLKNIVLVIDGFTRFSGEESYLIDLLENKCAEIVIGAYASPKAYHANFIQGNLYQAPIEFIRHLAKTYKTKPQYVSEIEEQTKARHISQLMESRYDFNQSEDGLAEADASYLKLWESINLKEEVTQVARQIRQLLAEGVRYKDILILLGDLPSYKLQLTSIFDKFDIPHYFGKAESMASHPLVHFVDSLERVKRYNYRAEDVLNLLKSGLYGQHSQADVDYFEHYVTYADLKGRGKFERAFHLNSANYNLDRLNLIRQDLVGPLIELLDTRPQTGAVLLEKFKQFLVAVHLPSNMKTLTSSCSELELDQHEQVWKAFSHILEQVHIIFGKERLAVADFLSLIRSGILSAEYRTVPATVDVVNIKDYTLIEPHTAKYVFALGMTRSHFPKITQNQSLISDQERARINATTDEHSRFDVVSQENLRKNHFVTLSLINSATQQLVISFPRLMDETEDLVSPYIEDLLALGFKLDEKKVNQVGSYKDVLSTLIGINRGDLDRELTKEEETFWAVAGRYLRRRLETEGMSIPVISKRLETKTIAKEVMEILYPLNQPLSLSSSALTTFNNNEYLYFLRYVLHLQEQESVHPDARHHGTYLHRIFELTMADEEEEFDHRLERAILQTNQESPFVTLYNHEEEGHLSRLILEDIARATATVLKANDKIEVQGQEQSFELNLEDKVAVRGVIDRVDELADGSLGVVDYKSGKHTFDIQQFYNGLAPQLITYLEALQQLNEDDKDKLFGAMYLHIQEPRIDLAKMASVDKIVSSTYSELTYKGLFAEESKEYLDNGLYSLRDTIFTAEELQVLLHFNKTSYLKAAQKIRQGHFAINPYTEDGETVAGNQLKSITHFEADLHMGQARKLLTLPRKDRQESFLNMMRGGDKRD